MKSRQSSTPAQFNIALNGKVTVLCLVTFPILVALGLWQLDRAGEKRERQAALEAERARAPAELPGAEVEQLREERRLVVTGRYRENRNWLLDNRQRDGQVGYEVVTPFELTDGRWLLVNRGWVAGERDRSERPDPPVPEGEVTLFGDWQRPGDHPLLDGGASSGNWPRVVLAIDTGAMAETLETPLMDHYLRLDEGSPGVLTTDWPITDISAAKHLGYAVQWFAMALAVAIWFVVANTNLLSRWRGRHRRELSAESGSGRDEHD